MISKHEIKKRSLLIFYFTLLSALLFIVTPISSQPISPQQLIPCNQSLIPSIVQPDGKGFLQGNIVAINGTVVDGCGKPVENARVSYKLTPENSPSLYYFCTKTVNDGWSEGAGWYNCSRSTANRPKGNYTIQMDVSKTGYPSNTTKKDDAFNMGNKPSLSDPNIKLLSSNNCINKYQFSVMFTDLDFNTNNITLWKSFDKKSWTLIDSQLKSGISIPVSSIHSFTPFDAGLNYFQFRTVDEWGFRDETEVLNFSIDFPPSCMPSITVSGNPRINSTINLLLADPLHSNTNYTLAFSTSTNPPIVLPDGRKIPLNFSSLIILNTSTLDSNGNATMSLFIPRLPNLVNKTFYIAFVTSDITRQFPQSIRSISRAVSFTILP